MAFCPSCGKEVSPQAFYFPNCGNNLSQASPAPRPAESVSAFYWLLPFFFALLGGVVAYVAVEDRDRKKATHMLVFGLVMTVIVVVVAGIAFALAFNAGFLGGLGS